MGTMTAVIAMAEQCAKLIEDKAELWGMPFSAEQSRYTVEVEQAAFRVRFVDCDGNRSEWLWSGSEVWAECGRWIDRCACAIPVA